MGAQYHGEYLSNMWEIFMWAQNNLWACVGIFWEWANEIKARKFVPQQQYKSHGKVYQCCNDLKG